MANAVSISIETKPPGTIKLAIRQIITWTCLVAAEGISHVWFGGSWVIDIMVIGIFFLTLYAVVARQSGMSVKMTPDEVRRWVMAGMPGDVKQWRETPQAKIAA